MIGRQELIEPETNGPEKSAGYLLDNQAPHPETTDGQSNADDARQYAGNQAYLGLGLEVDLFGEEGILDQAKGIDHDGQRQRPRQGGQDRLLIKSGNPGSGEAQEARGCKPHDDIKIKDRTDVGLRYLLFLNQSGAESAVKECLRYSDEDRQHPDQTELLGEQQPRQNDPDDELHAPRHYGLDKTP